MSKQRITYPVVVMLYLAALALFLGACSAPGSVASQQTLPSVDTMRPSSTETGPVPAPDSATETPAKAPSGKDQAAQEVIAEVESLTQPAFSPDELAIIEIFEAMQAEEIDALMQLVPEDGLVIAPYGVGLPEKGLTGEALRDAWQRMLAGAELSVVTYADALSSDLTGIIIEGLNPVEVQPAVGDPLVMTGYTLVELEKVSEGHFQIASLAVDVHGLMAEALAYPPFTDNPSALADEQARALIGELEKSLQAGDVEALAGMINYRGLVLAPYAVGLPNRGLAGEALAEALQAMLNGANPEVLSYQIRIGSLSILVAGLNPVQITPAVGDSLLISNPALLELTQDQDGSWILWAVIVDQDALLEEGRVSYKSWKSDLP